MALRHLCANVGQRVSSTARSGRVSIRNGRAASFGSNRASTSTFDVVLGGSLENMFTDCGSLTDAEVVFDGPGEKKKC